MPQFDFPTSPIVDQEHEQNGITFVWTGKVWNYKPPDVRTEIEIALDRKVSIAGDWMQGHLGLPHGDPIDPHHAASKAYVDRLTGGIVYTTDEPPTGVQPGTLWWETDTGYMYIYYDDGDSRQWVQALGGDSGTVVGGAYVSDTPPTGILMNGMLWWDSDKGALYASYDDGNSQQWVQIDGGGGAGGGIEEAPVDGAMYARQMAGWVTTTAMTSEFAALTARVDELEKRLAAVEGRKK